MSVTNESNRMLLVSGRFSAKLPTNRVGEQSTTKKRHSSEVKADSLAGAKVGSKFGGNKPAKLVNYHPRHAFREQIREKLTYRSKSPFQKEWFWSDGEQTTKRLCGEMNSPCKQSYDSLTGKRRTRLHANPRSGGSRTDARPAADVGRNGEGCGCGGSRRGWLDLDEGACSARRRGGKGGAQVWLEMERRRTAFGSGISPSRWWTGGCWLGTSGLRSVRIVSMGISVKCHT
jgi:hypothetical protein